MKIYFLIFLASLVFLPSCSFWHSDAEQDNLPTSSSPLINLVESTHIIRTLITKNKIGNLLEDHNPDQLALLLDNISPAKMAFESEVLSTTVPLVVVYYFKSSQESQKFIKGLKNLAKKYDDQIKFVVVDVDRLFSLAQDAEIENLPTILFVKNREIIDRFEGNYSMEQLEQKLEGKKQDPEELLPKNDFYNSFCLSGEAI